MFYCMCVFVTVHLPGAALGREKHVCAQLAINWPNRKTHGYNTFDCAWVYVMKKQHNNCSSNLQKNSNVLSAGIFQKDDLA